MSRQSGLFYEKKAPPYMEQLQRKHCMDIKNCITTTCVKFNVNFIVSDTLTFGKRIRYIFSNVPFAECPNAIVLLNERDLRIQDICFYKTLGIIISDIDRCGK